MACRQTEYGGTARLNTGGVMSKKDQLYNELLAASKAKTAANIPNHKLRTSRIKNGRARRSLEKETTAALPLDFLAIGDSWFEYPLYDNGPLLEETGVVAQSQLGSMGNPPPVILNQALHGQATTAILSWENQEKLITLLDDKNQWLNQTTGLPDAILMSGGGDDLVGDQLAIYLDYGGGGLNSARFQGALDSVKASYMDLFAFRDVFARGVPVVGHCYDYAIPNGVVPVCVPTAWLQPSLEFAGYNYAEGLAIVQKMIDLFHDMLASLASIASNNFKLIDTRNTVTRDSTSPTGWANEIHPKFGGFSAVANKFLVELRAQFPNRI
jgi:hypothetical protein